MKLTLSRKKIIIVICTYNRPHLLKLLLSDLSAQTLQAAEIIFIDGNPNSGEVRKELNEISNGSFFYVASNHANISFQRYLGWKAAEKLNADILLYLDDDLRIPDKSSVEKLISPIIEHNNVLVGTTAPISFPNNVMPEEYFPGHKLRRRAPCR